MRGYLLPLVPRQRPPELFGKLDDLLRDRVTHHVSLAVGGQRHDESEPGRAAQSSPRPVTSYPN